MRDCPIPSNIETKQIKVWFQNRRCREKQRKEASQLQSVNRKLHAMNKLLMEENESQQSVNRKLNAMNKLLMEENDRLQKQVSHLVYENGYFCQHTHNGALPLKVSSCESVMTSSQHHLTSQYPPPRDASPAGYHCRLGPIAWNEGNICRLQVPL